MNITNAQYTENGNITALVDGVQMSIPADAGNRHYAAMVEQGIEPAPYVEPQLSLEEKRARAFMPKDDFIIVALDLEVLSETDAEEATNGWPTGWDGFFEGQPARARIEAKARWAAAVNIHRNAPLIEALAAFKNLTPEQVDALFGISGV
jgi:hypothetical protein